MLRKEREAIYLDTDCFNNPTEEMLEAMKNTKIIGHEGYGEDPERGDLTIYKLEQLAAKKLGKESALFILNGTMVNIIAIFTHCKPGDKIIMEKDFHLYYGEIGGIGAICRVEPIYVESNKGIPDNGKIALEISKAYHDDYEISLICLENPHNRAGGIITPPNITKPIYELAHSLNIPIHLDGARIFNAAISLGIDASGLTRYVDSVMLCLNKGLGAPVGAILAGSKEFIKEARTNRKMLGGHMRQTGNLAAAGIVALNKMEERLGRDNENAKILGSKLSGIEGIGVDLDAIQVNKVLANIKGLGISNVEFTERLKKHNIYVAPAFKTHIAFRTQYTITQDDINYTVEEIKGIIKDLGGD